MDNAVTLKTGEKREPRPPRKLFTVLIYDREYDVYDLEGKEHEGYNDMPKTWWLYHAERLPEGTLPPVDSDSWKPFCKGTKRHLWDIRIKQRNTTKEKWDETRFSNNTHIEMYCNNKLFYSFGTFDLNFAFAKIQYLQVALSEHCFNFFNPEEERGRKIYWYGLPATVIPGYGEEKWEISIKPDYTAIPKEAWWKEYKRRKTPMSAEDVEMDREDDDRDEGDDIIRWGDAFSDGHIGWFRKDDDIKII